MKKIHVTARTLTYGTKQLGRGGDYDVNDYFAKQCEMDGSGKIIEDLGNDEQTQESAKPVDFQFLAKIKHHAAEIMEILKAEDAIQNFEAAKKAGDVIETEDDKQELILKKTDKVVTSNEKLSPIDELEGIQAAVNDSYNDPTKLIQEDFPGFTALQKKGITTMKELSELGYDDLIERGIRQGTANQIGARLAQINE